MAFDIGDADGLREQFRLWVEPFELLLQVDSDRRPGLQCFKAGGIAATEARQIDETSLPVTRQQSGQHRRIGIQYRGQLLD